MQVLKENKGITLIEIIVSIAILGIIVTPLGSLFVSSVRNNSFAKEKMIANQVAQSYMEKFMADTISYIDPDTNTGYVSDTDSNSGMTVEVAINEFNEEDSYENSTGQSIEYNYSANASEIDDTNNTLIIESDGTVKLSSKLLSLISSDSIETGINIEMKCNASTDKELKVSNESGKRVNIFKVKSSSGGKVVTIDTESGEVYTYQNVYDESVVNEKKNRVYKIKIIVKKGSKTITELASFKTID
ncbi:type II secretion system protein [Wukongibacter baidiensis]|uniref:type IV pilus modification PilV family protein n=1 Tax=Wukongibacter baidiensis TaxID=1723361 RepID=UPI003D7FD751